MSPCPRGQCAQPKGMHTCPRDLEVSVLDGAEATESDKAATPMLSTPKGTQSCPHSPGNTSLSPRHWGQRPQAQPRGHQLVPVLRGMQTRPHAFGDAALLLSTTEGLFTCPHTPRATVPACHRGAGAMGVQGHVGASSSSPGAVGDAQRQPPHRPLCNWHRAAGPAAAP